LKSIDDVASRRRGTHDFFGNMVCSSEVVTVIEQFDFSEESVSVCHPNTFMTCKMTPHHFRTRRKFKTASRTDCRTI